MVEKSAAQHRSNLYCVYRTVGSLRVNRGVEGREPNDTEQQLAVKGKVKHAERLLQFRVTTESSILFDFRLLAERRI